MKKLIIAIIILVVILTSGILETIYIDKLFQELDDRLIALENAIAAQDENSLDLARDTMKWWSKKRRSVELYTYSPDIRAFSSALSETEGYIMAKDYKSALSRCHSLIEMSKNIHQILDFNAEDII
ncbi:MAG: DUF4363 family protein [Clostridia bacterium]|nr:DUF4363 family protein [Clostridia bacterium]